MTAFIDEFREAFGGWPSRASPRLRRDAERKDKIRKVWSGNRKLCGARKVRHAPKRDGVDVARPAWPRTNGEQGLVHRRVRTPDRGVARPAVSAARDPAPAGDRADRRRRSPGFPCAPHSAGPSCRRTATEWPRSGHPPISRCPQCRCPSRPRPRWRSNGTAPDPARPPARDHRHLQVPVLRSLEPPLVRSPSGPEPAAIDQIGIEGLERDLQALYHAGTLQDHFGTRSVTDKNTRLSVTASGARPRQGAKAKKILARLAAPMHMVTEGSEIIGHNRNNRLSGTRCRTG